MEGVDLWKIHHDKLGAGWDSKDLPVAPARQLFGQLVRDIGTWLDGLEDGQRPPCVLFNCCGGQNRSATLAIAIVQRGGNTLLRHEAFGGAVDKASDGAGESELEWWEAGMSENSVSSVDALEHVRLCVSRVAWR